MSITHINNYLAVGYRETPHGWVLRLGCRLFICALFVLLPSCGNNVNLPLETGQGIQDVIVHTEQSLQQYIGRQWISPQGVGIGFVWGTERGLPPSDRSSTEYIHLDRGQTFNPYLILQAPTRTTVLVTVMLDCSQIEVELDGIKGLLHEITIEPGGDLEIPLKIDIPDEGAHELIVIAFVDPYNRTLDAQYRSSMDSRMVGRRAIIVVGRSDIPVHVFGPALLGNPVSEDVTLSLGVAFATASNHGHPSDLDRQLYIAKVKPTNLFNYQIWVSNLHGKRAYEYLLILFFDYHQSKIRGEDCLLVDLDTREEATIDSNIRIPESPGIYQMQLVYILDPYKSIANEEIELPFVLSSPRIAIETQP